MPTVPRAGSSGPARRFALRALTVTALAVALASPIVAASAPQPAESSSVVPQAVTAATHTAVADATVDEAAPTKTYGTASRLQVDGDHGYGRDYWSYLRFDLGTSTAPVTNATLRVYVLDSTSTRPTVARATGSWSEASITWSTKPAPGAETVGGGSASLRTGSWFDIDVTALVPASGSLSLVLSSPSSNGLDLASRETTTKPQLVVERDNGAGATASPGTTAGPTGSPGPTASPTRTPSPTAAPSPTPSSGTNISFPARGAFYYPWFPETWTVNGSHVDYRPDLGYYTSDEASVADRHMNALAYGNVDVAILSWWGQRTHKEDTRLPLLLDAAAADGVKVAFYYEKEGFGNPSGSEISADLAYLQQRYGSHPAAARVNGKIVVFVYNADDFSCNIVDRWKTANSGGAYLNLKVFSGYRLCANQPSGWHQYGPANAASRQTGYSFAISPGFWRADEASPRLARDLDRWKTNVAAMVASGDPWQLVTTFNEWGEGTAVEGAAEWRTASGYGAYLDALHATDPSAPAPAPTATPTATPSSTPRPTTAPTPAPSSPPSGSAVLVGAGDIAACGRTGDDATAALIDGIAGTVFTLGDNAYEEGTLQQFRDCYHPSWGRFKSRTKPTIGNHEYLTPNGQGYRDYFGVTGPTYYAYNAGSWRVYALDSDCGKVGGCGPGSPQYEWLKRDLEANPRTCSMAYMHHPKWTIGPHANDEGGAGVFWSLLHQHGVELIVAGHDHNYQRWTPMRPDGTPDPNGIRLIVNGAGGKNHTIPNRSDSRVQAKNHDTFGVTKLTLGPTSYGFEFIPEAGKTFRDSGTTACH
jgi:hypothetical protein